MYVKLRKSTVASHITTFTTEGCFSARLHNEFIVSSSLSLALSRSRIYEVFMFIITNNALFIRSLKNIKRSLLRRSNIPAGGGLRHRKREREGAASTSKKSWIKVNGEMFANKHDLSREKILLKYLLCKETYGLLTLISASFLTHLLLSLLLILF